MYETEQVWTSHAEMLSAS